MPKAPEFFTIILVADINMAADTEQCQGYTNKESGVTRAGTAIKRSLSNARDAPNAVL